MHRYNFSFHENWERVKKNGIMETCLNEGQKWNLDTDYLNLQQKDLEEKLKGVPPEDVLLVLLDAGNETLREIARSIRSVFR